MTIAKGPRGYKVAGRTRANIRQIASRARTAFGVTETRVDLVKLLEHRLPEFGVEIDIRDIADMPTDEAYAHPQTGTIVIRLDIYNALRKDELRPRFTIPHEVGHLVLHQDAALARSATLGSHRFFEDSEWQADTFAAEFMMPVELVQMYCRSASEISHVFGVSSISADIREQTLRKDNLIKW